MLYHMLPEGCLFCHLIWYWVKQKCEPASSQRFSHCLMCVSRNRIWKWFIHRPVLPCSYSPPLSFWLLSCGMLYRDRSVSTGLACSLSHSPFSVFFPSLYLVLSFSSQLPPSVLVYLHLTFSDCAVLCHLCEHSVSLKGQSRIFYSVLYHWRGKARFYMYSVHGTEIPTGCEHTHCTGMHKSPWWHTLEEITPLDMF